MSHEIYESRFVAVRSAAWHKVGHLIADPIAPSEAVTRYDLDVQADRQPLYVKGPKGKMVPSGMVAIGKWKGGAFDIFGTANDAGFELTPLGNVIEGIDELAEKYPLSAAGTLSKGSEVFFTLGCGKSEIAGEEYEEYLVVRHSYKPGTAHLVMWTPVRTVCRNTIIAGEGAATTKLRVAHTKGAEAKLNSAMVIAVAVKQKQTIMQRLEQMSRVALVNSQVDDILRDCYKQYREASVIKEDLTDVVDAKHLELFTTSSARSERFINRLVETTHMTYDKFNDEFPRLGGTAYALYQAVVEVADHRKVITGGEARGAESALVGRRAGEKVQAWNLLSSMN